MYDVKRAHSKRLTCCVQLSAIPDILKLRDEEGRSEVGEGSEREREQKKRGGEGGICIITLSKQFFFWTTESAPKRPGATL